jgi:NADPH:quinone reductase-like Zn-dependent oxidoreductase
MATLPVAWGAALYAVRERAYLRAGETVLVHSGAGAFGSAVIRLAQQIGAEVYTTVGARKRREFLIKEMGMGGHSDPEQHHSSLLTSLLRYTRGSHILFTR